MTADKLRTMLDYDLESGVFRWKVKAAACVTIGSVAGSNDGGYRRISISGKNYWAHRLAWLHVYGAWPQHQIDHIDGDRSNNRIANLRDVSSRINSQNRVVTGAYFQDGRWKVRIITPHDNLYLGGFPSKEEAEAAYLKAKRTYHEGFVECRYAIAHSGKGA
jgi:hypothetical protein